MAFTFAMLGFSEISDPNDFFGGSQNSSAGNVGETFTITGNDFTQVTTEGFPDDVGSDLEDPVTINGTTYPAGENLEANYEVIFIDPDTGLYHRVTGLWIDNEYAGVAVSVGWDATTGEYVPGTFPEPGTTLTAIDGDDLDGTPNVGNFTTDSNYTGVTGNDAELNNGSGVPVCFAAGTMILTPEGERPVDEILPGDRIETLDNATQVVRWVGHRRLTGADLAAEPRFRPVRIRAGALGLNLPARDLIVSPQHRVLVRSAIAERMFGAREVLVAARQLVGLPGIAPIDADDEVTYVHILCDDHEIVYADGALAETLYLGLETKKSLTRAARREIADLLPGAMEAARTLAPGRRARRLAERHARNAKALVAH